jgi:hypothetical protein
MKYEAIGVVLLIWALVGQSRVLGPKIVLPYHIRNTELPRGNLCYKGQNYRIEVCSIGMGFQTILFNL